jgi:RAB6A-GEF complex partner protein 1
LSSTIVLMSVLGDSLLVYCQDNVLYHFLIVSPNTTGGFHSPPRLAQFGQISFRGIIHSPARVRAMSWILPVEHSRKSHFIYVDGSEEGDPSEDAAVATIIFLLDGKLVLLRPSARHEPPGNDLKYDMRVLSDKVEWFMVLANQGEELVNPTLNGSLWAWNGSALNVCVVL